MRRSIIAIIGLLIPSGAFAAGKHLTDYGYNCAGFIGCPPGGGTPPPDAVAAITSVIVINAALLVGALAVVAFIYGAIRMIISRGEEGKAAGQKALIAATIGLIFAILTGAIMTYIWDALYAI